MLYVVGMGPGDIEGMTIRAYNALEESEVITGYTTYVELIKDKFPGKEWIATPMMQEEKRCQMALDTALSGKDVAMVCSGDSGIYGMAGLLFELKEKDDKYSAVSIEVVPGVTAACSGASLLGAPIGHDFAVISLSDLLTPFSLIIKRIRCAAEADFAICLYNPASKKRKDYLRIACEEILNYRKADTVCGYTRQIGRKEETFGILTLDQLREFDADMFTTVFIGNSMTRNIGSKMITPRGYRGVNG